MASKSREAKLLKAGAPTLFEVSAIASAKNPTRRNAVPVPGKLPPIVDFEQRYIDWNKVVSKSWQAVPVKDVPGLTYVSNYMGMDGQEFLWKRINSRPWFDDLKRRVQHYGYKYDYKARRIDSSMYLGNLPNWLQRLAEKLHEDKFVSYLPDQVIVNEYAPGQGISNHIDCEPCFNDTILSLSLGSTCTMNFTNKVDKTLVVPVWLEPGSLVVMQGESRYNWLHCIPARLKDEHNSQSIARSLRISLTFRKVKM